MVVRRSTPTRALASWLLVAAAIGVASCSGSPLSVKVSVYNTVDEARKAGAMSSGWIPDGVPPGAGDLRVGHMEDGRHWGVFSFTPPEETMVRALIGTEITSGTLSCEPPRRLEWWPRLLFSPVDVDKVRSTGFHLYHAAGERTYAINWGQGRAYYWRS